jgi:hypothetical protein
MQFFKPGQRWYSSAEPELGLGTILRADARQVDIVFTGCGELKHYTASSAPLLRARFSALDIVSCSGEACRIDSVSEQGDLLTYHCGQQALMEGVLDAEQPYAPPALRLLLNQSDESHLFDLRRRCLTFCASVIRQQADQEGFEHLFLELLSHYGCTFSPLGANLFVLDASQLTLADFEQWKAADLRCTFSYAMAAQEPVLTFFDAGHALFQAAFQAFLDSHLGSASFMVDDTLPSRSAVLETVFTDVSGGAHGFALDAKLNELAQYAPNEQAVFRARGRMVDLKPFKRSLELIYPSLLDASVQAAQSRQADKLQALRLVVGSEFTAFGKSKR